MKLNSQRNKHVRRKNDRIGNCMKYCYRVDQVSSSVAIPEWSMVHRNSVRRETNNASKGSWLTKEKMRTACIRYWLGINLPSN